MLSFFKAQKIEFKSTGATNFSLYTTELVLYSTLKTQHIRCVIILYLGKLEWVYFVFVIPTSFQGIYCIFFLEFLRRNHLMQCRVSASHPLSFVLCQMIMILYSMLISQILSFKLILVIQEPNIAPMLHSSEMLSVQYQNQFNILVITLDILAMKQRCISYQYWWNVDKIQKCNYNLLFKKSKYLRINPKK